MPAIEGDIVTTLLRRSWDGWKRFGRRMADAQSRVLLSLFYFVVIAPFAAGVRLAADPLGITPRTPKGWRRRAEAPPMTLERAREQF
jgi:hypothetical protein